MYTNGYIFRYAAIMVIIAAAVLSTAAVMLKPFQERNMAIEKMGGILTSANVEVVDKEATIDMFNQYVVEAIVIDKDGNVVESIKEGSKQDGTAFKLNMKKQLYLKSKGEDFQMPLFLIEKDGVQSYVIPLWGSGLWGPLWGNIALKDDLNTVVGVTLDHQGETPGLGAEISRADFMAQFTGKEIFDTDKNLVSVAVVKGGIQSKPEHMWPHGVDAISGGTITCNGVTDMLKDVLECYEPYLKKEN